MVQDLDNLQLSILIAFVLVDLLDGHLHSTGMMLPRGTRWVLALPEAVFRGFYFLFVHPFQHQRCRMNETCPDTFYKLFHGAICPAQEPKSIYSQADGMSSDANTRFCLLDEGGWAPRLCSDTRSTVTARSRADCTVSPVSRHFAWYTTPNDPCPTIRSVL